MPGHLWDDRAEEQPVLHQVENNYFFSSSEIAEIGLQCVQHWSQLMLKIVKIKRLSFAYWQILHLLQTQQKFYNSNIWQNLPNWPYNWCVSLLIQLLLLPIKYWKHYRSLPWTEIFYITISKHVAFKCQVMYKLGLL